MPVSFFVSNVLEDARQRCDLPTFTSATFITDTAALNMAIESCFRLSGIVRSVYGADYFQTESDITTTAGVQYVALPTSCTRLLSAKWVRGTDDFVELMRADMDEASAWSGGWSSRAPLYRLRANGINFFPTPDATHTVRLIYDTGIVVSALGDSIPGDAGWREWLTLDLCAKFRQRENDDDTQFLRLRADAEGLIRSLAERDKGGIRTVRDMDAMPRRIRPWDRFQ